jgi:hypothetical protein|tara:strand:+ start:540 stop:692 length:153 start_codon:yes stop_codon:yes gene_type:complete
MYKQIDRLLEEKKELEERIENSSSEKEIEKLESLLYELNHSISIVKEYVH